MYSKEFFQGKKREEREPYDKTYDELDDLTGYSAMVAAAVCFFHNKNIPPLPFLSN